MKVFLLKMLNPCTAYNRDEFSLLHSNIFAIQELNLQNPQNVKAGMPLKNSGIDVEELR